MYCFKLSTFLVETSKSKSWLFIKNKRTLSCCSTSILKLTRNPANLKILTQQDEEKFRSYFPKLLEDLTNNGILTNVNEVNDRVTKIMSYNVSGGKQLRAAMLIAVYKFIRGVNEINKENFGDAIKLSWCLEMMASFFLIMDDIVDKSETRRGKTCWYKKNDVGLNAINDGVLIQMGIFRLLKKYFVKHKFYQEIVDVFLEVNLKTFVGQTLDCSAKTITEFSWQKYNDMSDNKTGYYTFYCPVVLAMLLAERQDLQLQQHAFDILMELGRFYQYQNDYRDCFGESYSGKVGTDIQEGKCSWLILSALEKCSSVQKTILKKNYGKWDEDSVESVRNIYVELKLHNSFDEELEKCRNKVDSLVEKMENNLSKRLMNKLVQVLLGYQSIL